VKRVAAGAGDDQRDDQWADVGCFSGPKASCDQQRDPQLIGWSGGEGDEWWREQWVSGSPWPSPGHHPNDHMVGHHPMPACPSWMFNPAHTNPSYAAAVQTVGGEQSHAVRCPQRADHADIECGGTPVYGHQEAHGVAATAAPPPPPVKLTPLRLRPADSQRLRHSLANHRPSASSPGFSPAWDGPGADLLLLHHQHAKQQQQQQQPCSTSRQPPSWGACVMSTATHQRVCTAAATSSAAAALPPLTWVALGPDSPGAHHPLHPFATHSIALFTPDPTPRCSATSLPANARHHNHNHEVGATATAHAPLHRLAHQTAADPTCSAQTEFREGVVNGGDGDGEAGRPGAAASGASSWRRPHEPAAPTTALCPRGSSSACAAQAATRNVAAAPPPLPPGLPTPAVAAQCFVNRSRPPPLDIPASTADDEFAAPSGAVGGATHGRIAVPHHNPAGRVHRRSRTHGGGGGAMRSHQPGSPGVRDMPNWPRCCTHVDLSALAAAAAAAPGGAATRLSGQHTCIFMHGGEMPSQQPGAREKRQTEAATCRVVAVPVAAPMPRPTTSAFAIRVSALLSTVTSAAKACCSQRRRLITSIT
jgi:hypothetical protein